MASGAGGNGKAWREQQCCMARVSCMALRSAGHGERGAHGCASAHRVANGEKGRRSGRRRLRGRLGEGNRAAPAEEGSFSKQIKRAYCMKRYAALCGQCCAALSLHTRAAHAAPSGKALSMAGLSGELLNKGSDAGDERAGTRVEESGKRLLQRARRRASQGVARNFETRHGDVMKESKQTSAVGDAQAR